MDLVMEQIKESTIKKEQNRLFRFIRKRVNSLEDAEDILQDVLFQFISGFDTIRSIESATSWLFRVARNRIIDRYRKKGLKIQQSSTNLEGDEVLTLEEVLPNLGGSPEEEYFRQLIWEEINEALDELPANQRQVFVMHEFEEKSFKEISEITGEGINTLLSRKRYAIQFLRKRLRALYEEL